MALIKCPECGKDVSSEAENCIHCGYPIKSYFLELSDGKSKEDAAFQTKIDWLIKKVKPADFHCPPPRARVCAKCGLCIDSESNTPMCRCSRNGKPYPTIEVDYPAAGIGCNNGVYIYIYENCVIPRNIGDIDSAEYKEELDGLYRSVEEFASVGRYIRPVPPNPKWFGIIPTRETELAAMDELREAERNPLSNSISPESQPQCPICHSTNISRLSSTKSFLKIVTFGLAGAGDVGKTWKCNNCGSKF